MPASYRLSFVFVVDREAVSNPEFPILVVDLHHQRGRGFRAIPSTIPSIECNLSLANMNFFEFSNAVDADGVFRGFANREDRQYEIRKKGGCSHTWATPRAAQIRVAPSDLGSPDTCYSALARGQWSFKPASAWPQAAALQTPESASA